MEAWPSQLQQLLNVENFTYTFGNTAIRSDVDVGVAKVRSRYTDAVDVYTSSIDIDIADWSTLRTFYKTTLGNGTRTFAFIDPLTGGSSEFRFSGPPKATPLGGRVFRVEMQWEKLFG